MGGPIEKVACFARLLGPCSSVVERIIGNDEAAGSIPAWGTAAVAQLARAPAL